MDVCKYDGAYTFIFSPREGTPAASMEDFISMDEKNQRLYRLNEKINTYSHEANEKYLDQVVPVLIEGVSEKSSDIMMGYTDTMKLVNVKADTKYIGTIVNVRIKKVKTWSLDGELEEVVVNC